MSNPLPPSWNANTAEGPISAEDLAFQDQVLQAQPPSHQSGTMRAPTLEDMLTHNAETTPPARDTDLLNLIEKLQTENAQIEELRAENAELKTETTRLRQHLEKALSATKMDNPRGGEEVERYRQMLDKARERLSQAEKELDMARAREQDYENLLEEKSEQIRKLHMQLQAAPTPGSSAGTPTEEELRQLFAELQRERSILEEDRGTMEQQFKEMELGMARERAELGRQRAEVKRLQAELEHLKAMIARGDQLALTQLREEFLGRKQSGSSPNIPRPSPTPAQQLPSLDRKAPEAPPPSQGGDNPRKSLFGRRYFTGK
jgi:chromosome segregation ATPase